MNERNAWMIKMPREGGAGEGTYTIDRIWKKSYFAKSLCGWCSCSYCEVSSAFISLTWHLDELRESTPSYDGTKKSYRPEIIDK